MDFSPEGKSVCVGKSAQAYTRAGGKSRKKLNPTEFCVLEKSLGRFYGIRTANQHR